MFNIDFTQFNKVMDKVLAQGEIDAVSIVLDNGKKAIKNIVVNTPMSTGQGRAGWTPAWTGVGLPGAPMTPAKMGSASVFVPGKGEVTYNSKGKYKEDFDNPKGPSITFSNDSTVTTSAGNTRNAIRKLQAEVKGKRGPEARKIRARIKAMRATVKGKRSNFTYLRALNAGTLVGDDGKPLGKDEQGFFTETFAEEKMEFKQYLNDNFKKHSR